MTYQHQNDTTQLLLKRYGLSNFLSVKAEDRTIKNAFLVDENGQTVDCNIYPKNNYHVILCENEDGSLTNRNGIVVYWLDSITPQYKLARTEKDFEEIYTRELDSNGLKNKNFSKKVFNNELVNCLDKLTAEYKEVTPYSGRTSDPDYIVILSTAERFKEWLMKDESDRNTDPMDLLKDDPSKSVLLMYEKQLKKYVNHWKNGSVVELCAAYCIYLIDNKMFNNNGRKSAIAFARQRYNINITSSFDKLRKTENTDLLKKKMDEIKRIISGNYYGKL